MQRKGRQFFLYLILTLAAWFPLCIGRAPVAAADNADIMAEADEAYAITARGLDYYHEGDYESAAEKFEELIDLRPHWKVMFELRRRVDLGELTGIITGLAFEEKLEARERVADAVSTLLRMMSEAQRRRMLHIDDIDQILDDFRTGDHHEYLQARVTLIEHDRYSVPHLLEFLAETGEENRALIARTHTTLRDIGRSASLTLATALQTDDEVLKSRIISILGEVGDRRALPALLAIAEDDEVASETVEAAWEAIGSIQQRLRYPVELQTAPEEYEKIARLYLQEDATHVGHIMGGHSELWEWDAGAEEMSRRLTIEFVPSYIYYQVQGGRMALEGQALEPDNIKLQSLLISLMAREMNYLREYEGTDTNGEYADRRLQLLHAPFNRIASLYGANAAGLALKEVLDVEDDGAALRIIHLLGEQARPEDREAADALSEALDYDDPDVRFQAALAVLRSSPRGEIVNPEDTIYRLKLDLEHVKETGDEAEFREHLSKAVGLLADNARVIENYPVEVLEPLFLQALDDFADYSEIQENIVICLTQFGTEESVTPLSQMAQDSEQDDALRALACRAIAAIGHRKPEHRYDEEVYNALYSAMQHEDENIQREAAAALNVLEFHPDDILSVAEEEMRRTKILSAQDMEEVDIKLRNRFQY